MGCNESGFPVRSSGGGSGVSVVSGPPKPILTTHAWLRARKAASCAVHSSYKRILVDSFEYYTNVMKHKQMTARSTNTM